MLPAHSLKHLDRHVFLQRLSAGSPRRDPVPGVQPGKDGHLVKVHASVGHGSAPQLIADDRPIRPWLYRVGRNLLIDADRAARARPVTVQAQPADDARDDTGLDQILDRELVTVALQHLSPAHRTVLVETFYRGGTTATVARQLGIPHGTARSRLHYALQALRQQLQDRDATAA